MTNTNSSFIDAVEQLAIAKMPSLHRSNYVNIFRQALTETLEEAEPVAEVAIDLVPQGDQGRLVPEAYVVWLSEVEVGTLLFTAPPTDERDARIAELEALLADCRESAIATAHLANGKQRENDELRTQLAAAQAELERVKAQSLDRLGGLAKCGMERDEARANLDSMQAALTEYIAAADNSMSPAGGDDVAAMLRFAAADKAARAAIAADPSAAGSEAA